MFGRLALVCGLVHFLQPVACYRVNLKKLVSLKASERNRNSELAVTNDTLSVSDSVLPSSLDNATKHDQMLDFMEGAPFAKRSIGNMFASVGLMRARLLLTVASSVMPAPLADKVLPAALVQHASAPEGPPDSTSFTHLAVKGAVLLIVVAVVFMVSSRLLDVVSRSKVLGGDAGLDPEEVRAAVLQTIKIAVPQCLMFFLYMVNEIVSTVSIGRVGTKEQLAACGLCNMMMNAFLIAFTFGMLGPTDALVSTAWGAGDKDLCMAYLSKARFLGVLQLVWLFPIFWFAEPILLFFGQEPEVAVHAAAFCKVLGVAYVPFYFNISINWLLKNIGEPMVGVWGLLIGNVVHIVCAITLVVFGGWGNLGVALSWTANQLAWKIYQDSYVVLKSGVKDQSFVRIFLFDPQLCRTGIWAYVKLAIPSILASGSEGWFWEAVTMIIGTLSSVALASHVATVNVNQVLFMGPMGMVGASATIVGTYLGSRQTRMLRFIVTLFPAMAFVLWSVVSAVMILFRHDIAKLYCNEVDVQELMATLLGILSIAGFVNSMQAVVGGCLKGMAKHSIVANIIMFSYYMVALPLAYILGLKMGLGVYGVYAGFVLGLMTMFVCMTYTMARVDLDEEAEKATARMEANKTK